LRAVNGTRRAAARSADRRAARDFWGSRHARTGQRLHPQGWRRNMPRSEVCWRGLRTADVPTCWRLESPATALLSRGFPCRRATAAGHHAARIAL